MNPLILVAIGAAALAAMKRKGAASPTDPSGSQAEGAESQSPSLPGEAPQGSQSSAPGGGGSAPLSSSPSGVPPTSGSSSSSSSSSSQSAKDKAEVVRIVRESNEIINGTRDSYSSPDADAQAALVAARAAAASEAKLPPPKPISASAPAPAAPPSSTSSSSTRATPSPVVTVTPAASTRDPKTAAQTLAAYARKALEQGNGAALGIKGKPSLAVQTLQREMGNIVADGIYGPGTRARGAALGVSMPIRK